MTYLETVIDFKKRKTIALKKKQYEEAQYLVTALIQKGFKFKRVYLYGSVVKDKPLTAWSDIDLAIEGLSEERFLKALALLIKISHFPIDLKPYDELDSKLKERIKKEGLLLYEG